jgi:tetratricopeptide (TPR) repeat protein
MSKTIINFMRSLGLAGLVALSVGAGDLGQTQTTQTLVLNQPLEHEIKGGEAQVYSLWLEANQTARVEVVQKGIEVSLAAYNPAGARFLEAEIPSGSFGSDLILVTATESGEYKVAAEAADPRAPVGKYEIKLTEIRPTMAEDNLINERAKQITALANETNEMRQKGTREGRRQAIANFERIVELSHLQHDKIWEVVAVVQMGMIYDQLGEMQKSIDAHELGLRLAREAGNREHEGSALNNVGNSYKTLGDYEKAIFYLTQSLEIQRETNDKRGEAIILNNLGGCYLLLGDLNKAKELFGQSVVLRRLVKDQKGEGSTLNNLGQAFQQSGDPMKSIEYLRQALELKRATGDKAGEAITLRNLGRSFWAAGDHPKGFDFIQQSNTLAGQLGDRRTQADTLFWLAAWHNETGDRARAVEDIENGLALIEQIRGELVSPDLRIAYFSTVQQFYDLYTELLLARYEQSKNPADAALTPRWRCRSANGPELGVSLSCSRKLGSNSARALMQSSLKKLAICRTDSTRNTASGPLLLPVNPRPSKLKRSRPT